MELGFLECLADAVENLMRDIWEEVKAGWEHAAAEFLGRRRLQQARSKDEIPATAAASSRSATGDITSALGDNSTTWVGGRTDPTGRANVSTAAVARKMVFASTSRSQKFGHKQFWNGVEGTWYDITDGIAEATNAVGDWFESAWDQWKDMRVVQYDEFTFEPKGLEELLSGSVGFTLTIKNLRFFENSPIRTIAGDLEWEAAIDLGGDWMESVQAAISEKLRELLEKLDPQELARLIADAVSG
jgi:hypothetical protein